MKQILYGILISLFLPSLSLAASNGAAKNDSSTPYYNSGFNFGLASYSSKSAFTASELNSTQNVGVEEQDEIMDQNNPGEMKENSRSKSSDNTSGQQFPRFSGNCFLI